MKYLPGSLKAAAVLLIGVFGFMLFAGSQSTLAQSNQERILGQLCEGQSSNIGANCRPNDAENQTEGVFRRVVQTALWVSGIVSAAMVIIGGMMYVFSSGGPEQTARARNTIIYALIGLAVSFLGIALLEFVLDRVSS